MQSHVLELRTCNALLLLNYGVLLSTVHESTAIICWCRDVGAVVADFELNREYIDTSYPKMHQNLVRLNWLNSASSKLNWLNSASSNLNWLNEEVIQPVQV